MMFLALFSFYLLARMKVWLAILFLIFSILIKYATFFLIPVFIYMVWKMHQKQKIHYEKVFYFSALSMLLAFFLSPIREEIYPWYAIWFLLFVSFLSSKKFLVKISLAFSFSLLLRYIPFMLTGTYFGQTPILKTILTFTPPLFTFIFLIFKEKIWIKKYFRS